jgi:hypothetical protein
MQKGKPRARNALFVYFSQIKVLWGKSHPSCGPKNELLIALCMFSKGASRRCRTS